jgi:hypothetical protein
LPTFATAQTSPPSSIDSVISKEIINPALWDSNGKTIVSKPEWGIIEKKIRAKYGKDLAKRNILSAQLKWYTQQKDTANLVKYTSTDIMTNGMDTLDAFSMVKGNNTLYYLIFKYEDDPKVLRKALFYTEIFMRKIPKNPGIIDTYANLLYKIGRRKEALDWEKIAFDLAPKNVELIENYDKMKRGEKTW